MAFTQERYRDWMAPIGSKDSMEPLGWTSGIGPIFGFNGFNISSSGKANISVADEKDGYLTPSRYTKMSNKSGQMVVPDHAVVTPDGILTLCTGVIEVSYDTTVANIANEYVLIATHVYSESEKSNQTTFKLAVNTSNTSLYNELLGMRGNSSNTDPMSIDEFIGTINNYVNINISQSRDVICGLYKRKEDGASWYVLNPYYYIWPSNGVNIKLLTDKVNVLVSKVNQQDVKINNFINVDGPNLLKFPNTQLLGTYYNKIQIDYRNFSAISFTINGGGTTIQPSITNNSTYVICRMGNFLKIRAVIELSFENQPIALLDFNEMFSGNKSKEICRIPVMSYIPSEWKKAEVTGYVPLTTDDILGNEDNKKWLRYNCYAIVQTFVTSISTQGPKKNSVCSIGMQSYNNDVSFLAKDFDTLSILWHKDDTTYPSKTMRISTARFCIETETLLE